MLAFAVLVMSCSLQKTVKVTQTPHPGKYDVINQVSYDNGYPKIEQPLIVFSDRDKNAVNASSSHNFSTFREVGFLNPFIILKQKKGMCKIAEYKQGIINDGKILKKAINVIGWIPSERLLYWNGGLRNSSTGFSAKAALVINNSNIFINPGKYLENDSVLVFTAPDLINKTKNKLNIGRIVYIYKQSEDKECFLIGENPATTPDSIKNHLYGWVSRHIISMWGERTAIKLNTTDSVATQIGLYESTMDSAVFKPIISFENVKARTAFENIYPLQPGTTTDIGTETKFFANALNYDANKIYNVLGGEVYYKRFREILANNKKLNIVFVLDVSQNNKLYMPVVKSLLQELQLRFASPSYFSSIKFGSVVYKQITCGVKSLASPLSSNYRDITTFLEEKNKELYCSDTSIVQPMDKGLSAAANMLSATKDETNIIILIGTTATQNNLAQQAVINTLSKIKARLIFFQTQAKSADAYNDFVLMSEKIVVNSAQNITELKKEKIINQDDLLTNNSYNLVAGETGIYFLDFPGHSMTQGFVIFPKKGEAMQANLLKNAIDSMLQQVTNDNRKIDSTLTVYFRSDIGINNTFMSKEYNTMPYYTNKHIPTPIASCLLGQNSSFLIDGYISDQSNPNHTGEENGILLNEQEYDYLNNYYSKVYKETISVKKFRRKKAVRTYMKMVMTQNPTLAKIGRSTLKKNQLAYSIALNTGFATRDSIMINYSLKDLKKNKTINDEAVYNYFRQYQQLAGKMATAKGDEAVRIKYLGQHFYWLNEHFMPTLKEISNPPI